MRGGPPQALTAAVCVSAGVILAAALLLSDGRSDSRLAVVGLAAVVLAGLLLCLSLLGALPGAHRGSWRLAACLASALGALCWSGASIAWSIAPDRSWAYFDRGVVYAAFLIVGLAVGSLPRAPRVAAAGLAGLLALVLGWALLGKAVPALGPDDALTGFGGLRAPLASPRLSEPVGYSNALALLCALAVPLALWVSAARRASRVVLGALLLFEAIVSLLLTASRGGILVVLLLAFAWLALVGDRLRALLTLTAALPPAAAVVLWAFTRPALTEGGQPHADRVREGALLAVFLLLGAAVTAAVALLAARRHERWRLSRDHGRRATRRLALGLVGACAVAFVLALAQVGGLSAIVNESEVPQGPSRIPTGGSNHRSTWWGEAARVWSDHPLAGTGVGTFGLARRLVRENALTVVEPHSLPLQALAETGLVGFCLVAATTGLALVGLRRALGRACSDDRLAVVALSLAVPAYLVHGLLEIDWDFLAVSAPVAFVLGVVLAAGRSPSRPLRRPLTAAFVALAAAAAGYSLAAPWLSSRRATRAETLLTLARPRPAEALAAAQGARRLNPLSLEAVAQEAFAQDALGRRAEARRLFVERTRMQPQNPDTWYDLGVYELARGDPRAALADLNRSYTLDNYGPVGDRGSPLDQARCRVDPATCPG